MKKDLLEIKFNKKINHNLMEKKTVQSYAIEPGTLINEDHKKAIEDFLQLFSKKFEIEWNKDVSLSISVKHKEVGNLMVQVIKVSIKDVEVSFIDMDQEVIPFMENVNKDTGEVYEIELIKTGHLKK